MIGETTIIRIPWPDMNCSPCGTSNTLIMCIFIPLCTIRVNSWYDIIHIIVAWWDQWVRNRALRFQLTPDTPRQRLIGRRPRNMCKGCNHIMTQKDNPGKMPLEWGVPHQPEIRMGMWKEQMREQTMQWREWHWRRGTGYCCDCRCHGNIVNGMNGEPSML